MFYSNEYYQLRYVKINEIEKNVQVVCELANQAGGCIHIILNKSAWKLVEINYKCWLN